MWIFKWFLMKQFSHSKSNNNSNKRKINNQHLRINHSYHNHKMKSSSNKQVIYKYNNKIFNYKQDYYRINKFIKLSLKNHKWLRLEKTKTILKMNLNNS